MSRRVAGISLALFFLLSSEVWALGLGDIKLDSALGEPLRAQIELLSATPDELDNLTIALASADTFERYGLDRPFYLQGIEFTIVRSGRADGNVVVLRSRSSMAEPFLTFLVEATWSRGRLLREYTVLLDPPTFAPPAADTAPAVQAPSRSQPSDSGQIRRPAPAPQQQRPAPVQARPAPAPAPAPQQPKPEPVADDTPFDTAAGGDVIAERGTTLWGIASRVRPDSRLTMNQTMLAIFEANPEAFGGNINVLRAGAALRIPSADEIFRISRNDALEEAKRHHAAWGGGTPVVADTTTQPSLTLVPPDEDYLDEPAPTDIGMDDEPLTREMEVEQRIAELESAEVPQQQSLIEIRDNELAALREELARIRGEVYEPAVEDMADELADDPDADIFVDEDAEDLVADDAADTDETAVEDAEPAPSTVIQAPTRRTRPGLMDRVLGFLQDAWMWIMIGGVVLVVGGLLFWFMRRDSEDDDDVDAWQPLDSDETVAATASIAAPQAEESFVVEETAMRPAPPPPPEDETFEAPAPAVEEAPAAPAATADETGSFDSLEDTFSSETAINLDQTDPIAEADFHMAYGLYDQAADLVNGALELEPDNPSLLTKLCEIYFVWGNRDAFVDAAGRLKASVGDSDSEDWNKIVIMGQQIASDSELFAGESAAAATKAVDLSFESDMGETGALDMELIAETEGEEDVFDIGASDDEETAALTGVDERSEGVDFAFDAEDDATAETGGAVDFDVTREMASVDETAEMPTVETPVDTPTIEQQFETLGGTAELPSIDEAIDDAIEETGQAAEETAEINLDDLGLDVDSFAETELASIDDLDATGELSALTDTGIEEVIDDPAEVTGKNPEVDPDATGIQAALSDADTGVNEELEATGTSEALDENLLDATGMTQVLSSDHAVDTTTDAAADLGADDATMLAPPDAGDDESQIGDDQETLLATLDDDADAEDFDFAKTEALPKEAFTGEHALEETGELPAMASTDMDLDLDDLTAALEVSEAMGDTVEQPRDDATVEQPRPTVSADEDSDSTLSISEDDMSEDLHDARTMTEVGTKLDLARAYVDMGDPAGARSILEEVLDEGDEAQRQQAQQLLDSLPS